MSSNTDSALPPSRFPVGSSASTMRGLVTSARATAARWRSPPDSSCGRWTSRAPSPTRSRIARALCFRLVFRRTPHQQRHGDIFQRREFRQQVMELVDESQRAIAQFAARLFIERMNVAAGDLHDAGGRTVEAAQDLQQRGLAGARGADDRDAFAGANRRDSRPAAPAGRSGPGRNARMTPVASSTVSFMALSFMAKRLRGQRARCAPRRVDSGQRRQRQRHTAPPATHRRDGLRKADRS